MAMKTLVLQSFKKLHRTRLMVFAGDTRALDAARTKINEEYRKNKHISDEEAIKAMIKFGEDVEKELRQRVIQAREVKPGVFEARISSDTLMLDNVPFNDAAILEEGIPGKRGKCCQQPKDK